MKFYIVAFTIVIGTACVLAALSNDHEMRDCLVNHSQSTCTYTIR